MTVAVLSITTIITFITPIMYIDDMEMTTIAISVKNKQRLANKGRKGQSYDDILEELLK